MMLRRLIGLVVVIIVTGVVAHFLSQQQGSTVIEWMGWRIEARTSLIAVLLIGTIIVIVGFDRLYGYITGIPRRITGSIAARRQNQGHHALALGLVAVSAGDGREATRQARKAERLIGTTTLTELLSAQAAVLNGDHDAATGFFKKLSDHRETAFIGKAGMMRLLADDGRDEDALESGREAFRLNRNAPSLAKGLFALEARHENWAEAIAALKVARRDDDMDDEEARRTLAALLYKKAETESAEDEIKLQTLEAALKEDPAFLPALMEARRLYRDLERDRKVVPMLKRALQHRPQPAIIETLFEDYSASSKTGDADALAKIIRLVDKHGNDQGSLIATARLAMRLELWGEALRLLTLIPEKARNIAAWQMMADLADHAPDAQPLKADWPERSDCLIKASRAPRPDGWSCTSCNTPHQDWQDRCMSCDSFATVTWS
jgi:HemY protein